jgi:hypothetical protein
MDLAALAGFEVLAVDHEDLGRAILVGRVLGVESGGEDGGERQQKGAAGEKFADENVHRSP